MNITKSFASLLFGLLALSPLSVHADGASSFLFDSGSTGADGVLDLTETECPTENTNVTIDVGSNGIKNYESISVHANCIVKFTPYGNNSAPVRLIVQGNVIINGQLNVDGGDGTLGSVYVQGLGGKSGPGGYDGGNGGQPKSEDSTAVTLSRDGHSGFGPGGGMGGAGAHDSRNGLDGSLVPYETDAADQPLVGGSGGGGAGRYYSNNIGGGGGGGGGALLIATSGQITLAGTFSAMGGVRGGVKTGGSWEYGGQGAHGMVHLIANTIDGTGSINSGYGVLETLNYIGGINSSVALSVISFQQLTLNQGPTLAITSVEGQTITSGMGVTHENSGDILVAVTATKLPAGTQVTLVASGETRTSSTITITLDSNGSASGTVSIVSGVSLLTAYISGFVEPIASLRFQEEKIVTTRLETIPGNRSRMVFFTESGRSVPPDVARDMNLERYAHFGLN